MAESSTSTKGHEHTFKYWIKNSDARTYKVSCKSPCTIEEALMKSDAFKKSQKKNMPLSPPSPQKKKSQKQKELLILRGIEPQAAVSPHFPCQLIEPNEKLTIQYIPQQPGRTHSTLPKPGKCESLVTFSIQTQGGKNIVEKIMKNKSMKNVHNVCIYAYKGENVKTAMKRDGRFSDVLFQKHCGLRDINSNDHVEMSYLVDDIDQRHFQVIQLDPASISHSQESTTGNVNTSPVKSEELRTTDFPEDFTLNEEQAKAQNPSTTQTAAVDLHTPLTRSSSLNAAVDLHTPQKRSRSPNAKSSIKMVRKKTNISIPVTEQNMLDLEKILDSVQSQFKQVSKQLKKQKNIWEIFREEYDKSAMSCCDVHTVKTLVTLADNVCRIRINGYAMGTGFILFHIPSSTPPQPLQSFIITNAHVLITTVQGRQAKLFDNSKKLYDGVNVTAEFEEWKGDEKKLYSRRAKKVLVACEYNPADHLDFALLELEPSEEWSLPAGLLNKYRPSPPRGGICIIGHPDGEDKKMDPSFIVEPQNQFSAVMKHMIKNKDLQLFMQKKCLQEEWAFDSSRITYNSCFFHGSSGSPVFDSLCSLIGIHSGGYSYSNGDKAEKKSIIEYAYPLENTLKCIIRQSAEGGRKDVSEYIQSQPNISEAITQGNQSIPPLPGLDTEVFRKCIGVKDAHTLDGEPMDTS